MKLGKVIANITIFSLILFIFFDYVFPSKGVEEVNRLAPQLGRTIILLFMTGLLFLWSFKEDVFYLNPISKSIIWLGALIIIHFAIMLHETLPYISTLIKTFYWIIGYFFIFHLSSKGFINERHVFYFTFFGVLIFFAIVLRDYANERLQWGDRFYSVSNNGYNLLRFLPLVFLIKKGNLKYILIGLIGIGSILSNKRGTMLAFSFAFIISYAMLWKTEKDKVVNKFKYLFFGISIVLTTLYFISKNMDSIQDRFSDLESTDTAGSGRGKMYKLIFRSFGQSDTGFDLIIGNGFYSTADFFEKKIGHRIIAHSDWLEMLYDFGLLGIIIFSFLFININRYRKKKKSLYEKVALLCWLVLFFLTSLYSINLYKPEMIYSIFFIAYLQGKDLYKTRLYHII